MPNYEGRSAPLTDDELREVLEAHDRCEGNISRAAKYLGIKRATLYSRLKVAEARRDELLKEEVIIPKLESGEIPVEDKIAYMEKKYLQKKKAKDARTWFPIKVNTDKPIGVAFVGDPHVDSGGCNWPLLRTHCEVLATTDGLYAINLGDTTDNWVGRLSRLYAHNPATRSDAIDLAEWLISGSGVKWLAIIRGNHDMWTASRKDDPLSWFRKDTPMVDWSLQCELQFKGGAKTKIHAAHSFKGNSYINNTHGMQRRERESGGEADIYAQGHQHEWAAKQEENPLSNKITTFCKARGYKDIDTYADVGGFGSQQCGATVTVILEPLKDGTVRVHPPQHDLEAAAKYLTWLRNQNA